MLTLTEAAAAHLAEILVDRKCSDDVAVRLVCRETGRTLRLDNLRDGDATLEHGGRTVLLFDENVSRMLDGKTIDVRSTGSGGQLFLAGKDSGSV